MTFEELEVEHSFEKSAGHRPEVMGGGHQH